MAILPPNQKWTAEEDRRLRILWEAEWPVLQIAVTLERSKGSITGRVHRLALAKRPSPIPQRVCPDQVHAFRTRQRELAAGLEAARHELARAA